MNWEDYRTTPRSNTIQNDSTSTCRTQKMLQQPQKLGQQYFFPSINSMNTWTNRIASSLPRRSRRKVKIIPSLDCLVTCKNKSQRSPVYRKRTHTDGLLDFTILFHTKWLLYKPWREEHKLFATHTTAMKPGTWTLLLLRTSTPQTSSKQETRHCLQEYPNLNIWGDRFCSKCFEGSRLYSKMWRLHTTKQWGFRLHRKI